VDCSPNKRETGYYSHMTNYNTEKSGNKTVITVIYEE
jgi:hypothetical protein